MAEGAAVGAAAGIAVGLVGGSAVWANAMTPSMRKRTAIRRTEAIESTVL